VLTEGRCKKFNVESKMKSKIKFKKTKIGRFPVFSEVDFENILFKLGADYSSCTGELSFTAPSEKTHFKTVINLKFSKNLGRIMYYCRTVKF
jgi:hypothetical protein